MKTVDEFPQKRKLDPPTSEEGTQDELDSDKRQKIDSISDKNDKKNEPEVDKHVNDTAASEDEDGENGDEDGEEDYNGEKQDAGDENANQEAEIVIRKEKGIMTDFKGKGKIIEDSDEDDEDEDEDDSSDDSGSDILDELDESDWEGDSVLDVNFNLLSARIRKGSRMQCGVQFLGDSSKSNDV